MFHFGVFTFSLLDRVITYCKGGGGCCWKLTIWWHSVQIHSWLNGWHPNTYTYHYEFTHTPIFLTYSPYLHRCSSGKSGSAGKYALKNLALFAFWSNKYQQKISILRCEHWVRTISACGFRAADLVCSRGRNATVAPRDHQRATCVDGNWALPKLYRALYND